MFNRFERSAAVGRSGRGGAAGFGLGLNYVQQVMLAHGGRVEVESEEGRFSEFTLYFPIETV
ncbi:ATP-binding protein [Bacteroides uniformis]|nr:ATP-binding protein [Bacteroides uniformis]